METPVLIFPEGQRSVDGTILPGEAGVGLVIAKSKAPVLPMRIFGAFEAFPRAKIPKFFTKITVSVGDMITLDEDQLKTKTRESYQNLSDCVMNAIAKIEKPEPLFNFLIIKLISFWRSNWHV